jgi:hypothetical protein
MYEDGRTRRVEEEKPVGLEDDGRRVVLIDKLWLIARQ